MTSKQLLVLLCFFPLLLCAQEGKDSLYINPIKKEFTQENFLQHTFFKEANFGAVAVGYSAENGDLRLSNKAFTKQDFSFYTYGFNTIGKTKISGDFLFDKQFEDSLANSLNNTIDHWSPMNYYATKAGTYERQNYRANVTISQAVTAHLRPFINVLYHKHWSTGSVDPRLESNKFVLKYNPGVAFEKNQWASSVKLILGKSYERQDLTFKNISFKESLLFPERIAYLNLGYGYISIKDTSHFRKFTNHIGGEFSLAKRGPQDEIYLQGSLERSKEELSHDVRSRKEYTVRSRYIEQNILAKFTWIHTYDQALQAVKVDFEKIHGYDGNNLFSSNLNTVNYNVDVQQIGFSYQWNSLRAKPLNYDFGLQLGLQSINRSDYASYTAVENNFLHVKPNFSVRFKAANQDNLQLSVAPMLRKSVHSSLSLSENSINTFSKNVVIPDYAFYATDLFGGDLKAQYLTKRISANFLIGIAYEINYMKALNKETQYYYTQALDFHGKSRIQQRISLQLYL